MPTPFTATPKGTILMDRGPSVTPSITPESPKGPSARPPSNGRASPDARAAMAETLKQIQTMRTSTALHSIATGGEALNSTLEAMGALPQAVKTTKHYDGRVNNPHTLGDLHQKVYTIVVSQHIPIAAAITQLEDRNHHSGELQQNINAVKTALKRHAKELLGQNPLTAQPQSTFGFKPFPLDGGTHRNRSSTLQNARTLKGSEGAPDLVVSPNLPPYFFTWAAFVEEVERQDPNALPAGWR